MERVPSTSTSHSSLQNDSKQQAIIQELSTQGNVLTFTPPGLKQQLHVKFPDSRLAVCVKCKKNFKTRDMCRVRNNHTTPPWTTAFICITLDSTCLDEQGKLRQDRQFAVRMVQQQPYCVRQPFDSKTPVCAACKRTNRTKCFCRERHKHRQLPWCTVYVLLSTMSDSIMPNTTMPDTSKQIEDKKNVEKETVLTSVSLFGMNKEDNPKDNDGGICTTLRNVTRETDLQEYEDEGVGNTSGNTTSDNYTFHGGSNVELSGDQSVASTTSLAKLDTAALHKSDLKSDDGGSECESSTSDLDDTGDDIHDIADSRTFLAKVSSRSTTLEWLELVDVEANDTSESQVPPTYLDNTMYQHHMYPQHPQQYHQYGEMMMMPPFMGNPGNGPTDLNQSFYHYHHPAAASSAATMELAAQHHHNSLKSQQQYFYHMHQQQLAQHHHHSPYPYMHPVPPWMNHPYSIPPMPPSSSPPSCSKISSSCDRTSDGDSSPGEDGSAKKDRATEDNGNSSSAKKFDEQRQGSPSDIQHGQQSVKKQPQHHHYSGMHPSQFHPNPWVIYYPTHPGMHLYPVPSDPGHMRHHPVYAPFHPMPAPFPYLGPPMNSKAMSSPSDPSIVSMSVPHGTATMSSPPISSTEDQNTSRKPTSSTDDETGVESDQGKRQRVE